MWKQRREERLDIRMELILFRPSSGERGRSCGNADPDSRFFLALLGASIESRGPGLNFADSVAHDEAKQKDEGCWDVCGKPCFRFDVLKTGLCL